jgi:hypothetical protein
MPTKEDCNKKQTYEEKELELLRNAVDILEKTNKGNIAQSPVIKQIIIILEKFLKDKKLVCYGGTAINNILPKIDQFYDRDLEIPDYDFYSPDAMNDAKELADIYASAGFDSVEARSGAHLGTFKVFVQFISIADITQMEPILFKSILKETIKKEGILYAPVNFLRLNVYKELSRPAGDISRWEKIYKRLNLLNKNYPIENIKCNTINFMRDFEGDHSIEKSLYNTVKNAIIKQKLVFIGGYASSLYGKYMSANEAKKIASIPDFDALAKNPKSAAIHIKDDLEKAGFTKIKIYKKPGIGEIIAPHYEIVVDTDSVCFIYEPLGCHSYNTITINKQSVKIATIDTMLNLFLAFLYADRPYYDHDRIICMCEYLFKVQHKNKLKQKGLLKRFTKDCYGTETTIESIRATKAQKHKELKFNRNSKEYLEYFMKYDPAEKKSTTKTKKNNTTTTKTKKNKTKTKKNWTNFINKFL